MKRVRKLIAAPFFIMAAVFFAIGMAIRGSGYDPNHDYDYRSRG